MSTSTAKRPLESKRASSPDDGVDSDSGSATNGSSPASKRQERKERKERKPGRKPLETEAKDKRTAQNRAAQRAFRERRDRKMQELEDKVNQLESLNKQSELETKFLRNQVTNLLSELERYNPELPKKRDSILLDYLAKQRKASIDNTPDFAAAVNSASNGTRDSRDSANSSSTAIGNSNFQFEFPWKMDPPKIPSPSSDSTSPSATTSILDNSNNKSTSSTNLDHSQSSGSIPSTAASNFNFNNASKKHSNTLNLYQTQSNVTSEFDFNSQFDESVSSFCSKLSMACGTKSQPFPRASPLSTTSSSDILKTKTKSKHTPDTDTDTDKGHHNGSSALTPTHESASINTVGASTCDTDLHHPLINDKQYSGASLSSQATTPNGGVDNAAGVSAWHQPSFGQLGFRTDQLFDLDLDTASPITKNKDLNCNVGSSMNSPANLDGMYWNLNAPATNLVTRNVQNPELPFIDSSLAFPDYDDPLLDIFKEDQEDEQPKEEADPIQALINEEPSMPLSQGPTVNEEVRVSESDKLSDQDEMVQDIIPSNDGTLLKCSEVWDRITAHPRYSDLDIDGLCLELRTKAKCSEKGVVVDAEDVQKALLTHMQ
ncbi:unnamed protein product [Kluyveromyces dobzhanskii CBS 2104]|uniref:WGS project CCBQ000000000 data, contig 00028 n=1 Tax=Kluyveromyces dobzhanskii CBS 2104 TaxID=1427455 RepID=A0A0A8L0X2_9SACH|nr:unnamed protein product [Kluyveromyces dobzhanskii CBS 2104]